MIDILTAIISAGAMIIVSVLANLTQSKKTEALITYKIDELTKRVDAHNTLIERTYRLEESAKLFDEKLKVSNHRIKDLEEKVK